MKKKILTLGAVSLLIIALIIVRSREKMTIALIIIILIIALLFLILLGVGIAYANLFPSPDFHQCPNCQALRLKVGTVVKWHGPIKIGRRCFGAILYAKCENCHHRFKKDRKDWEPVDDKEWEEITIT